MAGENYSVGAFDKEVATPIADPNAFVRDLAEEKRLVASGTFTKEYLDSRGGVNAEGYYGDVPSYARLSAEEYKKVTKADGTINTAAQAALYQQKAYSYYVSQGMDPATAAGRASKGYGIYTTTFKDAEGNTITPTNRLDDILSGSSSATSGSTGTADTNTFAGLNANNEPTFTYGTSTTPMTAEQYAARTDVMDTMRNKFKDYGLESLIPTIEQLAIEGATESTIFLTLRESDAYKQRFSANEDRKKAGLAVLDPKTYLAVEDGYRQTLRSYGLTQFDNDAYVKQFIANDVSPTELSNRVATAVQRVQNASPDVINTLTSYYGIPQGDLVAYILDPKQQYVNIERKVTASEIGAQAARQGLQSDVAVSEALAAQGISGAEAAKGYATIADILPTAQKLSDIYSGQAQRYDQSAAEQETFNSLASAQRKRQKLTGLEIGSFSGQSGASKGAFSTGYLNKQSSAGQF
jgi:hypothetical protein